MPTIPEDRARLYMAALGAEKRAGKNYLLNVWETGHVFRSYEDHPVDIALAVGRSPAWVYDRLKLAGGYTKAQLIALIDKHSITSVAELMSVAFGRETPGERTRRGVHLPLPLVLEAEAVGLDLMGELKTFFSLVSLSELRPILGKYIAEHEATKANAGANVRSLRRVS